MDDQVKNYIQKNSVSTKDGRKCVDGRYQADENSGMIARPGADFGYVMGLLALKKAGKIALTPEEIFDAVFKVVTQNSGIFYMHTDHHAKPESIGCGHIAKATLPENAQSYGVEHTDVQRVLDYAKQKASQDAAIKIVNLPGEHQEQGVLVVISADKSINSQDTQEMYFVYDKTRDDEFITNLVEQLDIPGLRVEDLQQVLEQQTNTTLHLLALGKPIYQINVSSQTTEKVGEVS